MIPLFKPCLSQAEITAVTQVLRSGWIGSGPKVAEFERQFAHFVGAKYAVAVSSASSALQLSLQCLDLKPKDEVITPSLTFIAGNHAILLAGGSPVFCDVDSDTLCANPQDIAKRITSKTRAVIVMHYGGHPVDLDPLVKLCRAKKIALIEDCAHAAGSCYKGKHVGTFGLFGCFSFAAIKNLTTGDGGMIMTNNRTLAERLRTLRWSGISKDTWTRVRGKQYSWEYDVKEVSGKHQMNDIAAAIGLVQLKKLHRTNAQRAMLTRRYNRALNSLSWLKTPIIKPWAVSSHHNYVINVPANVRNRLHDYLSARGIATAVHYLPTHHYRLYRVYRTALPVTDQVFRQILLLPLHPDLSVKDQQYIISALKRFKI